VDARRRHRADAVSGMENRRRWLVIAVPYLWLAIFFLAPFLIVLKISLSDPAVAQPPYLPVLDLSSGLAGLRSFFSGLDFDTYRFLGSDALYINAFLSSLKIALVSTALALVVAFPLAYGMARAPDRLRPLLVMLVILPFWTSFLIRVYAWIGILRTEGLLNQFLLWTGAINEPLAIMNTTTAVYIGIVYSYLPFMVLPIYSTLEKMDESLLEAAIDLGCTRLTAFWLVTLPLALPGIIAGCFLVFIPAMGEFVIPDLLGGSGTLMMGKTLWSEFFSNRDWPVASAVAIVLLLSLIIPILIFQRQVERQQEAGK
jgi:putrescine transport system permease protein